VTVLVVGVGNLPGSDDGVGMHVIEAEDITTISEKCTPKVQKSIREVVDLIKGLLLLDIIMSICL
jgi:hypothetical protein